MADFESVRTGQARADSVSDAGGEVGSNVKDRTSRMMNSAVDNLPLLGNDSVESLMRRADEASNEARSAEERAVALAEEAKAASDEAKAVSQETRQRAQDVKREAERESLSAH